MVARLLYIFVLAQLGCIRSASSGLIEHEVEVLVGEPGSMADQAELRLVARGLEAIPFLETGLYQGDARGRRRVIRVLQKIGNDEALPIIEFLALRDKEPQVRSYALKALDSWNAKRP